MEIDYPGVEPGSGISEIHLSAGRDQALLEEGRGAIGTRGREGPGWAASYRMRVHSPGEQERGEMLSLPSKLSQRLSFHLEISSPCHNNPHLYQKNLIHPLS